MQDTRGMSRVVPFCVERLMIAEEMIQVSTTDGCGFD